MARKRRVFSPAFKAKVALEALKGHHTIHELCQKHSFTPLRSTFGRSSSSKVPKGSLRVVAPRRRSQAMRMSRSRRNCTSRLGA